MDKNNELKSTTTAVDSTETTDDGWGHPDPDSDPQPTEPTATTEPDAPKNDLLGTAEETSPPVTEDTAPTTEPEPVPVDTPPEESPAPSRFGGRERAPSISERLRRAFDLVDRGGK